MQSLTDKYAQEHNHIASSANHQRLVVIRNAENTMIPSTTIRFGLPESGTVSLTIYDVNGRLVRTLVSSDRAAGMHEVVWDACDDAGRAVSSGVYVYRLTAGADVAVRRMVLVR
jgi:flagellar hook assembly protein FlgD